MQNDRGPTRQTPLHLLRQHFRMARCLRLRTRLHSPRQLTHLGSVRSTTRSSIFLHSATCRSTTRLRRSLRWNPSRTVYSRSLSRKIAVHRGVKACLLPIFSLGRMAARGNFRYPRSPKSLSTTSSVPATVFTPAAGVPRPIASRAAISWTGCRDDCIN